MSETAKAVVAVCLLLLVYVLTRKYHTWRIKRTCLFIIRDLEDKGALSPSSAVALSYGKTQMFRVGMRDYRPRALEYLIQSGIVSRTQEEKYYLKEQWKGALT